MTIDRFVLVVVVALITVSAARAQDIVGMFKRVKPSVVTVVPRNSFGLEDGQGSGFFISATHVLTNYHVIDNAAGATIRFNDSTECTVKRIVAKDSANDLAVLDIDIPKERKIFPLPLSTKVPEQGEKIYVVGNPLGYEQSVSDGIVSSVRVTKESGKRIQFTAAISSGSSGSPLLTAEGQVLGVVSASITSGQNLNFAVPVEMISALVYSDTIEFIPSKKEYWGQLVNVKDAFTVDTNLTGRIPDGLETKQANIWRIRRAAERSYWPESTIEKNMNRLLRSVKRNYEDLDLESDTILMDQARYLVYEGLGHNINKNDYSPEHQGKIEYVSQSLAYLSAGMLLKSSAKPVLTTTGVISKRAQLWQECYEGNTYMVFAVADTTTIADLDVAVFHHDGEMWKPVASNTGENAYPYCYFTAPTTGEYAIVLRTAKMVAKASDGVFGVIMIYADSSE